MLIILARRTQLEYAQTEQDNIYGLKYFVLFETVIKSTSQIKKVNTTA